MIAFILRALDEIAAGGAAIATVTVPATPAPIDRVAGPLLDSGVSLLRWEDPAPDRDGRVWSFAGFGEAARVEGSGEARFDEIRGRADELFASLGDRVHPEAGFAPPPRLHGGLAFRPEPVRAAPWAAFRDGSFVLPRWLYGTSGDRAFLRLALRVGERRDAADLEAELRAFSAAAAPRPEAQGEAPVRLERVSPEIWEAMIGDALARIRAHELEKVVPMALSRVFAASALDAAGALDRLGALYPECVRFAFQREDAVFLGASPERLVDKRGLSIESDALAGSAPRRRDDDGRDARAPLALLESDKDRREHHIVVDAIQAALSPLASRIRVPAAPVVRTLRNVHHLWTPITATLARPLHVLDLVRVLHPTPAVCGTPREAAIRWIAAHEPDTRGWYAGAVGWFDAAGDGAFSVAIRSGVLARREAWLYAGAGIVEGSDASLEYAETRVKQAPMLAALGLAP
jgi:salicylate biosynthesis isochorismate synthase